MFRNYFTAAFRSINKNRFYTIINAFGLSVGIAFCLLIYFYINDEKSFDQFHKNKERIFRVNEVRYLGLENKQRETQPDGIHRSAYLPAALVPTIKEEIADVEFATRFINDAGIIQHNNDTYNEEFIFIDRDFFQMFSFPVIKGNKEAVFNTKNEVVLTSEIATKYFAEANPVGETISIAFSGGNEVEFRDFLVTAVVGDPPANSSFDFKFLVPIENRPYYEQNLSRWRSFGYPSFIQLRPETNLASFDSRLEDFTEKYFAESINSWRQREKIPEDQKSFALDLTPLGDIHWNHNISWHKVSNPQYSLILAGIAVLILLIACINYISLSLTNSSKRSVEVGIRKCVGADRKALFWQFAFESQLLAFLSMVFSLVLVYFFLPYFNEFTGKEIGIAAFASVTPFLVLFGITILVGFLAGIYPSVVLSLFKPIRVLKGAGTKIKSGFSKYLVVLQFSLSAFMILSSIIMYRQMVYITTKDLGYDQEHIVVIPTFMGWTDQGEELLNRFQSNFQNDPDIISISGTSSSFNRGWSRYGFKINGERKSAFVYRVDPEYANTLNLDFIAGRNFSPDILGDINNSIVVNEALVRDMGWDDPLNQRLDWKDDSLGVAVIGVVKDYHFLSLEREIEPMFLHINPEDGKIMALMVKLKSGTMNTGLEKLQEAWKEIAADKPFEYSFLDDDIDRQYEAYAKWTKIMGLSTVFSILIACLGLFGLAGINAVNRTKEIGIRKVFGAGFSNILYLMNRQYILLALIAFIMATPVSWWIMNGWLESFKYAITIEWELFLIAMLSAILVAIGTVTYHSIIAARVNPAKTLKYE